MRIELNCAECGSNRFALDEVQSDSTIVRCGDCGHIVGTLGELKERIAQEVISRSSQRGGLDARR